MGDQDEGKYSLLMPFVSCRSRGGPYDDEAYVAGFSMGLLYASLEHERLPLYELPVYVPNCAQLDLIAMRHGYSVEITAEADEWCTVVLRRVTPEIPNYDD
jgi:hypothetical protein